MHSQMDGSDTANSSSNVAEPGTVFYSREAVRQAKLHRHRQNGVDCVKDPELYADAVISGSESNKDMGGLLMQGGSDFLIYYTGGQDTEALAGSQKLGKTVRVIRKVRGANPRQAGAKTPVPLGCQYVYIHCGLYEVTRGWQIDGSDASFSYFHLMRVPGQPALKPQQMFFAKKKSPIAHANRKTWQAYTETLQKDCSVPCEHINPLEPTGISPQHDAELATYDLCDVCGIDGNGWRMTRCGCCLENQQTLACLSCIPKDHAEWIQADEDQHHWQCRRCRAKDLRPVQGCVFEDADDASASGVDTIAQSPALNMPHQTAAASADIICLSDSDQDPPAGSQVATQSAPQALRAQKHPRSTPMPTQPKASSSKPLSSRQAKRAKHGSNVPSQPHQASPSTLPPNIAPPAMVAARTAAAAPASAAVPIHQPASAALSASELAPGQQALPATFAELAGILNQVLSSAKQLTEQHVKQLTNAFGDVPMLMDLLGMPDSSFNDVLKANTSLDAMQIVTMRCRLNSFSSK